MSRAPSAVTPLDPGLIEVGDAIGQRAQRRGLVQGVVRRWVSQKSSHSRSTVITYRRFHTRSHASLSVGRGVLRGGSEGRRNLVCGHVLDTRLAAGIVSWPTGTLTDAGGPELARPAEAGRSEISHPPSLYRPVTAARWPVIRRVRGKSPAARWGRRQPPAPPLKMTCGGRSQLSPLTVPPKIAFLTEMAYPSPLLRYQWSKVP
jgi:hypothetical protein